MTDRASFFEEPDKVEKHKCEVCGSVCDVTRGVVGATSWAGAMAHKKRRHDYFRCPKIEEDWHKLAVSILRDIRDCNSPSIKKIMQKDVRDIIHGQIAKGLLRP